ncbi:MAG: hypothetical protein DRQ54_03415, partial [Gammaproteobacteria bacterium]
GCPLQILDLSVPEAVLFSRVRERSAAGTDASEADVVVLTQQLESFQPLAEDELMDVLPLDADQPDALDQAISRINLLQHPL